MDQMVVTKSEGGDMEEEKHQVDSHLKGEPQDKQVKRDSDVKEEEEEKKHKKKKKKVDSEEHEEQE